MRKATRKKLKSVLVLFLMVVVMIPGSFAVSPPQHVEAQTTVFDPTNFIANTATRIASELALSAVDADKFKEFVLDALVWFANNVLIKHITRSVVNWINSGFEGNPAFVTDFQGFLTDAIDAEIGRFIEGSALGFLCDPFQLQIRVALAIKYRSLEDQISCRLTEVVDNIDNFISGASGSFYDGGWRGWFQLVKDDNPYNRYLEASAALDVSIATARGEKIELFRAGGGFLSWEQCDAPPASQAEADFENAQGRFAGAQGNEPRCEIVTPGSVIETQLNETLSLGGRRITVADEINEIIGALLAQLATQVLGGGSGLRGLSRSSGGSPSYLDRVAAERDVPEGISLGSPGGEIIDITQGIEIETRYRSNLAEILNAALSAETRIIQLGVCSAQDTVAVETQLNAIKDPLNEALIVTDRNLAILNSLQNRRQNATTIDAIDAITAEFEALVDQGTFHTYGDVVNIETNKRGVLNQLGQIDARAQQLLTQCQQNGGQNFGP